MVEVGDHPDGCVVSVRAQPRAKRTGIVGMQGGAIKIAVAAPPEHGRANRAFAEVLAAACGLKKSQVELLSGPTNRDKAFLLHGIGPTQATQFLQDHVAAQK